jgi:hypothetical protein
VGFTAVRRHIGDVLSAPSDQPARKALLRLLIEEIRVESREAIHPTFRVPLSPRVRLLDGLEHHTWSCSNLSEVRGRVTELSRAALGALSS